MQNTQTRKSFRQIIKDILPHSVKNFLQNSYTAFITPILYSLRTGHFKSAYKMMAVDSKGYPIPWYTYPCVDFLKHRSFKDKTVLEFGGGQSTLWWANKAKSVVTLEGSQEWLKDLEKRASPNVAIHLVNTKSAEECANSVNSILNDEYSGKTFDIIVIDGLWRDEMSAIAIKVLSEDGALIYDNSEREGFYVGKCYETFKEQRLSRVDFFGYTARACEPSCTSIFFQQNSFIVSPKEKILL